MECVAMNPTVPDAASHRLVRIHINREPYQSPSTTTGAALYSLAGIEHHQELFREVDGDEEDQPIASDATELKLDQDEHFYSKKEFLIYVNTREKLVATKRLTFNEIVLLAYDPPPSGPNIMFVILYADGPRHNPKGTLPEGASIKIKNGMTFDVTPTDKS